LNLSSPQDASPARGAQGLGSGFWKLESHFGPTRACCMRRPRALLGTHSSSPSFRARNAGERR